MFEISSISQKHGCNILKHTASRNSVGTLKPVEVMHAFLIVVVPWFSPIVNRYLVQGYT